MPAYNGYKRDALINNDTGNLYNVLAIFGNRIYGFEADGQVFPFAYSDDNGSTWTPVGVSLKQIYDTLGVTWNYPAAPPPPAPPPPAGLRPTSAPPQQILYQSDPAKVVYIATSDAHVFSTSYEPNTGIFPAKPGDPWVDVTPPTPSIPQATATWGRYTNAKLNGPILFYGCYNQDLVADNGKGMSPYNCANLYRRDCSLANPSWDLVLAIQGARHMHSIEIDPKNDKKIFAVAGDGGTHGLWYSEDGGLTFRQISGWVLTPGNSTPAPNKPEASRYGIDMVFPDNKNILLEADGPCTVEQFAMILAFDRSTIPPPGQLKETTVQITHPLPPEPRPAGDLANWQGSSYGIVITQKGNLLFINSGENGFIGLRDGIWLSMGPDFNDQSLKLLEDLTPPVVAVSPSKPKNGDTVTVTTVVPRGKDWNNPLPWGVIFGYYDSKGNPQTFPNDGTSIGITPVASDETQFTLTAPEGMPPASSLIGGVAKLATGWNYVKTYEFKYQGASYFFNGPYRLTVPE